MDRPDDHIIPGLGGQEHDEPGNTGVDTSASVTDSAAPQPGAQVGDKPASGEAPANQATGDPVAEQWPNPDPRTVNAPGQSQYAATSASPTGASAAYDWPAPQGPSATISEPTEPLFGLHPDDQPPAGLPPIADPGHTDSEGKSGGGRTVALALGAAALALVAGTAGGAVGYQLAGSSDSAVVASPVSSGGGSAPADGSIASVAAAVTPAVVAIEAGQGSGSGFVVTSDGYIVTNNHVVEEAGNDLRVRFSDGRTEDAELVGTNEPYDLAVLKVSGSDLTVISLGSSEAVNVGDTAIAVGSPLGLSGTVTTGIVSALDRPVDAGGGSSFINAIQTDAAINPGNSGGPLLNGAGEVIGVNTAIATLGTGLGPSAQAGSIGLGFAIPIDTANRIVQEIIEDGSADTPIIGAQVAPTEDRSGSRIAEVTPGSPAEAAGLQADDVIIKVNGRDVSDNVELIVAIRENAVGDTIELTIVRDGAERVVEITLVAAS